MTHRFIFPIIAFLSIATAVVAQDYSQEIKLSADTLFFDGDGGTQHIKILKGNNVKVFCNAKWVNCKHIGNNDIRIDTKPYDYFRPRTTSLIITSLKSNYSKVVTLIQAENADKRPSQVAATKGEGIIQLSDINLEGATSFKEYGVKKNLSADNNAITLKNTRYLSGVGLHAPSTLNFAVNGATRFCADLGVDDEIWKARYRSTWGIVAYEIALDGKVVKQGEVTMFDNDIVPIDINLKGAKMLTLTFSAGELTHGDHVSLGNARFEYNGNPPAFQK